MSDEKMSNGRFGAILVACIAFVVFFMVVLHGCATQKQQEHTRIPNFSPNGQELADLRKQLDDTQVAAKQALQAAADAQKAKADIQAQLDQLAKDAKNQTAAQPTEQKDDRVWSCGDYNKCGPNEVTKLGIISDFTTVNGSNSQTDDQYLAFTFTDRTGFTKKFSPVCQGQVIKTDKPVAILYHWRSWTGETEGKRGCFWIDGFQQ